jgi:hypothetical protein
MFGKLLKWGFFTVLISLFPFGLVALNYWLSTGQAIELSKLWPHGELMLVATALAADALGDLIASSRPSSSFKIASGGGCAVVLLLTVAGYILAQVHPQYAIVRISKISIITFVGTIVTCLSCKFQATETKERIEAH